MIQYVYISQNFHVLTMWFSRISLTSCSCFFLSIFCLDRSVDSPRNLAREIPCIYHVFIWFNDVMMSNEKFHLILIYLHIFAMFSWWFLMIFNMLMILVYPKDAWNVLFDIFGNSDQISGARNDVVDGIDLQQTSSSSQKKSRAVQSFEC